MESKNKILQKLKIEGIAVVENYFDENFCSTAIKEIETIIIEKPDKVFLKEMKTEEMVLEYGELTSIQESYD